MFPLDPFVDPMVLHQARSHSYGLPVSGPAHWRDNEDKPVAPKKSHVRECDLSSMKYFTPKMYSQLNGYYIQTDEEIDEVSHQWDVNMEEYNRDVVPNLPDWVHDYMAHFTWLHDAKVELIRKIDECPDNTSLEEATFRFTPDASYNGAHKAMEVSFRSVWVNTLEVLPAPLAGPSKKAGNVEFLYDEFNLDTISQSGAEELSYTFFCSDGTEYTFEGLYGIEWKEASSEVVVDTQVHKTIEETVREAVVAKMGPPGQSKKKSKGKGRHGVRLFSCVYYLNNDYYVQQIKSKDWSTVWKDFQESFFEDGWIAQDRVTWEENLIPFHKDTRNVFMGQLWVDGKEVEVTIINTKRGKPIGAEEYEDLTAYCDV